MCLAGFIFSILPIVMLVLCAFVKFFPRRLSMEYTEVVLPASFIVLPLIGLALSIAGVITVRKNGGSGKAFGVAGIVLPSVGIVIAIFIAAFVLLASSSTSGRVKQNEMYSMGTLKEASNTEYDVSQYKLPMGYDLDPSDIDVSESEFKTYANSKLQTISSESDKSIRGTYQDYDFLIIKCDRLDDWLKINCPAGFEYHDGYAFIYHEETWELGGTRQDPLAVYKDPSDKYIIITNCSDHKVISEFFA